MNYDNTVKAEPQHLEMARGMAAEISGLTLEQSMEAFKLLRDCVRENLQTRKNILLEEAKHMQEEAKEFESVIEQI